MPIPAIRIDDPQSRGLPRQAVPLRLAYLITGLDFSDFLFLLAKRQEGRYEYLAGYQYAAGAEPREVCREEYEWILNASPPAPDATEDELIGDQEGEGGHPLHRRVQLAQGGADHLLLQDRAGFKPTLQRY